MKSVNNRLCSTKYLLKKEMRHQRGCAIVILCIVELVAEVDGHDAVGDASVPAKNKYGNKNLNTLAHTQIQAETQQRTCLDPLLCVKDKACRVKCLACRTKHSAFSLSCHSTWRATGK